jgi:hypothetical protein
MTEPQSHSENDATTRAYRASALKERIYVAFTALAVIIALRAHDQHPSASIALGTLAITVVATICAVYVADLLSHMIIHAHLPTSAEHGRMVAGTLGAGAVALPPLACLALGAIGVYDAATGLLSAMLVTIATLMAVGLIAARRLSVPRAQRVAVLAAESFLALAVIALELLSHR